MSLKYVFSSTSNGIHSRITAYRDEILPEPRIELKVYELKD